MGFWPQERPLTLTRRRLRYGSPTTDGEPVFVEWFCGRSLCSAHVRNEDPLGPTALRLGGHDRLSLGSDRMDRLAPRVPAAAGASLARDRALAGLSAIRVL